MRLNQSGNDVQLCICLVMKVKSDAEKNNSAQEPGMLRPCQGKLEVVK